MYFPSIIVLLLLWYGSCSNCSAEWIEISQQSYQPDYTSEMTFKAHNQSVPTVNMKFRNTAWDVGEKKTGKSIQYPSMQGFIAFLKFIKRTWLQNSMINIDEKVQQLQILKDQLFSLIEYRYNQFWLNMDGKANPSSEAHHRSRRGLLDESNFHFPPETALLSINFLTFAVFLIKLVLQVVNIVKTRHYNLSGNNNVVVKL